MFGVNTKAGLATRFLDSTERFSTCSTQIELRSSQHSYLNTFIALVEFKRKTDTGKRYDLRAVTFMSAHCKLVDAYP